MSDAPDRIWLQIGDPNDPDSDTWADQRINQDDIEYVRADIARELEDSLLEVVQTATRTGNGDDLDSMSITTYADTIRLLSRRGRLRIVTEAGRRVVARVVT